MNNNDTERYKYQDFSRDTIKELDGSEQDYFQILVKAAVVQNNKCPDHANWLIYSLLETMRLKGNTDLIEHSLRTSELATLLATQYAEYSKALSPQDIEEIRLGALLHDIGKVGISLDILNKPSSLSLTERSLMETHPVIGAEYLHDVKEYESIIPIILFHHEKYDGTGYPYNLAKDEIPLTTQIVSIADTFNAITTQRCYKQAMTEDAALHEISLQRGTQFDPNLVDFFVNMNLQRQMT